MMDELELREEETYTTIMEAKEKGLVEIIKTNELSLKGLISVTFTDFVYMDNIIVGVIRVD